MPHSICSENDSVRFVSGECAGLPTGIGSEEMQNRGTPGASKKRRNSCLPTTPAQHYNFFQRDMEFNCQFYPIFQANRFLLFCF